MPFLTGINDTTMKEHNNVQILYGFELNNMFTHWGRVTHICVSKIRSIIGSDKGLSPVRCQTIIWSNAGILSIETPGANFSEILSNFFYIFIQENAFENVVWKIAAILSCSQCVNDQPFCPFLIVLGTPMMIRIYFSFLEVYLFNFHWNC